MRCIYTYIGRHRPTNHYQPATSFRLHTAALALVEFRICDPKDLPWSRLQSWKVVPVQSKPKACEGMAEIDGEWPDACWCYPRTRRSSTSQAIARRPRLASVGVLGSVRVKGIRLRGWLA
jgi:hypothetical protein